MSGKKKVIAYAIYVVFLTVLFLVILFPEDTVRPFIVRNIQRVDPDISMEIGSLRPSLMPPGITMQDVTVYYQNQSMVESDNTRFSPAVFAFFRGIPAFGFKVEMFDGTVSGKCRMTSNTPSVESVVNAKISGINLAAIEELKDLLDYPLTGRVKGSFSGTLKGPAYTFASEFDIEKASATLAGRIPGIDSLRFESITGALTGDERKVTVERLAANGPQVDAELTGDIRLRRPYEASVLNLKGFIKPHSGFISELRKVLPVDLFLRKDPGEKGFPVRINGTIGEPGFSMK
ncbi:MAG: type II secretion system protein GspN [Thermodesulfobacteriota bacterium]|nr:type II secretion system protein GspN [Thermodesulfobacteriota bacterium]